MLANASVVCWWCVGSVLADASVGSDSLPLPYSAAAGKE